MAASSTTSSSPGSSIRRCRRTSAYYDGTAGRPGETLYGVFLRPATARTRMQDAGRLLQGHGQPGQRVRAESRCPRTTPSRTARRPSSPTSASRGRQRRAARPGRGVAAGFKLPLANTENRPLELEIEGQAGEKLTSSWTSSARLGAAAHLQRLLQHEPRRRRRRLPARAGADEQNGHRDPRAPDRRVGREPGVGVRAVAAAAPRASGPRVSSSSAVPVLPATLTPGSAAAVPVP